MPPLDSISEPSFSNASHEYSKITLVAAAVSLVWYLIVTSVLCLGYVQLRRYYSHPPDSTRLETEPDVTIIRPVKGLEPCLYECLASTFRQVYTQSKIHVRFCVSSRSDPSLPILEQLLRDFPDFDAQLLIEDEDHLLRNGKPKLGPNPKIRNMSRAFRESRGDIIWIIDCNVWVGKNTCSRMVQRLQGNKFVHHLPLVVDTTPPSQESSTTLGSRLEEMFLSSMHAKFYIAINTVLVAPASIGKSNMFRRSHLDSLTNGQGIDYFSYNICEDHLIGDLLWKRKVPEECGDNAKRLGKHAMCFGDLAIQPVSGTKIIEYWNRRVRWLRVRKFTVLLATWVEPGTEAFVCSLYGAFAFTTLPFFHTCFSIPQTWTMFAVLWLLSISIWCGMDWILYNFLHSGASIDVDEHTPFFARAQRTQRSKSFTHWLTAWLVREAMALPIWTWAFWGGTTVEWRGKKFWVGIDMKVHEIAEESSDAESAALLPPSMNGNASDRDARKARID